MLRQSARHPGELGPIDRLALKALVRRRRRCWRAARASWARCATATSYLVGVESGNERLREENRKLQSELHQAAGRGQRQRPPGTAAGPARVAGRHHPARADRGRGHLAVLPGGAGDAGPRVRPGRGGHAGAWPPRGWWDASWAWPGERADVQLAVDPRSNIHVVIPRTGGRGLLVGKGGENGYRCLIQYFARTDQVKVGDTVVDHRPGWVPARSAGGHGGPGGGAAGIDVPGGGDHAPRGLRPAGRGAGGRGPGGDGGAVRSPRARRCPAGGCRSTGSHAVTMRPSLLVLTALVLLLLQSALVQLLPPFGAGAGFRRCWWCCTWGCRRAGR